MVDRHGLRAVAHRVKPCSSRRGGGGRRRREEHAFRQLRRGDVRNGVRKHDNCEVVRVTLRAAVPRVRVPRPEHVVRDAATYCVSNDSDVVDALVAVRRGQEDGRRDERARACGPRAVSIRLRGQQRADVRMVTAVRLAVDVADAVGVMRSTPQVTAAAARFLALCPPSVASLPHPTHTARIRTSAVCPIGGPATV